MEDAGSVGPTAQSGWLTWEVEDKPVSVRLSAGMVIRLGMAVREGFKALPRRGLETGGLLIGTRRQSGTHVVIDITDFEPVECEHVTGPSYVLSDADLRRLEAKIAARKAASIVGFYRSHTRPDFAVTEEDTALFSAYFPAASDVFLLLKSNDFGPPAGGFIIRESGEIRSSSPYLQFSLDVAGVIPEALETPVPILAAAPRPPAPPGTVRWPIRWPIRRIAILAAVTVVALSYGMLRRGPSAVTYRRAPAQALGPALALNVINTGNSLRLTWDHAPHPGSNGVLWIRDGQEEQTLTLDSRQWSEGSVVYWPKSCDVSFRLELVSPGSRLSDSVRAVGGPCPSAVLVPPATAAPEAAPATQAKASPFPPAVAPGPKQPPRGKIGTASRELPRGTVAPKPLPKASAVAAVSLPDPPNVRPTVPPSQAHSGEVFQNIMKATELSRLRDGDPTVRVRVEPVSGSLLEHVGRNIPLLGKKYRRADYVPPAPLRNPPLPQPPHRNLTKPVNIDVKVHIDAQGKVESAEIAARVARAEPELADLAAASAQQCEFVAAHTADGPVPGVVIIHYQFGPPAPLARSQSTATR